MKFIKKREVKSIGFFFILVFIIFKFFNTPYNFYSILNWKYEDRMEQSYGFCKNESWGFYKYVINKFELEEKEIHIINDENYITLEHLFNIKKSNNDNFKFLLLLNYQSENDLEITDGKYEFIKNFKILFRKNNCYLLELND